MAPHYPISLLAAMAAAVATEPAVPEDDLASHVVLLQRATGARDVRADEAEDAAQQVKSTASRTRPVGAPPVPMDQMAKVGINGTPAWTLWPTTPPGLQLARGLEVVIPENISDPVFFKCGGSKLKHGYPEGFFSGHWAYNVAEPRVLPFLVPLDDPNRKDAAVVVAPGGGGKFLAIDTEGRDAAAWLNSLGISAFVVVYRVSTEASPLLLWPSQWMDCQRAMSLVRSQAPSLGLNASRIGFMGFSMGGLLTALMSTKHQRVYSPVGSADSVSIRPDFALMIYPATPPGAWEPQDVPPTFIAVSQDDPCVKVEGVDYWYRLHRSGAPGGQLHVYESGEHGWGTCFQQPYRNMSRGMSACSWTRNARNFLANVVLEGYPRTKAEVYDAYTALHPTFVREYRTAELRRQQSRR